MKWSSSTRHGKTIERESDGRVAIKIRTEFIQGEVMANMQQVETMIERIFFPGMGILLSK